MKSDMRRDADFSRFDVVEAWYVWLCTHHCGTVASSKGRGDRDPEITDWWCSYNRLSWLEMRLKFKPRPNLDYDTLEENGKLIHDDLCRRLGVCDCLKERAHGS